MYIIYRKLKIKRSEKTSYRDTKIALKKKKKKKKKREIKGTLKQFYIKKMLFWE